MTYQEALAAAVIQKTEDNYLRITFRYDLTIVLSYKEGIAMLQAFGKAEQLYTPYKEQHRIAGINEDTLKVEIMSAVVYRRYKIAALMGITIEEVTQAEEKSQGYP